MRAQALSNCLTTDRAAPETCELLKLRAGEYENLGKYELALEDLNRAQSLQPEDIEVYNRRGIVHKRLGAYKKAMQDYAIATELQARLPSPSHMVHPIQSEQLPLPAEKELPTGKPLKISPVNSKILFSQRTVSDLDDDTSPNRLTAEFSAIEISRLVPVDGPKRELLQ